MVTRAAPSPRRPCFLGMWSLALASPVPSGYQGVRSVLLGGQIRGACWCCNEVCVAIASRWPRAVCKAGLPGRMSDRAVLQMPASQGLMAAAGAGSPSIQDQHRPAWPQPSRNCTRGYLLQRALMSLSGFAQRSAEALDLVPTRVQAGRWPPCAACPWHTGCPWAYRAGQCWRIRSLPVPG